jgi:DNA-directed RNA polymerase beta subunit
MAEKPDTYGDEQVDSPDIMNVLSRIVKQSNGVDHHTASMNQFTRTGIDHIIKRGFAITSTIKNKRVEVRSSSETAPSEIKFNLTFKKTTIFPPVMRDDTIVGELNSTYPINAMYPHFARQQMRTYSNEIRVDADITATAYREHGQSETRVVNVDGLRIGSIPCMLHSVECNLYGKSRHELIALR